MSANPGPSPHDLTRPRRPTGQRGATLTELAVVMAIVGVLASMAVTTYIFYMPHLRLNNESRKMALDLLLARQLAIKENRIFYTCLNTSAGLYSIFRLVNATEDAAPCDGAGSERPYLGYVLDTGVAIQTACQAGATCTSFSRVYSCPDGLAALVSACPDTISAFPLRIVLGLTAGSETRLISVRLSGAVTVK